MKIDCCSDLHGFYPKLEGGDLLIVAGDLTSNDQPPAWASFLEWLAPLTILYKKIMLIGGNHDNALEWGFNPSNLYKNVEYLCDSGTEFVYYPPLTKDIPEGTILYRPKLKIWGSPWTKKFVGMNPLCRAFTVDSDEELAEKWALIPQDTDILITHSPAYGFGDEVGREDIDMCGNIQKWTEKVGSRSLAKWVLENQNTLRLHVCGHIHEGYGIYKPEYCSPLSVNASHMNRDYKPVNKPIRVFL